MNAVEPYLVAFLCAGIAAFFVMIFWPTRERDVVLNRLAEGDACPSVFYAISDATVQEFLSYQSDDSAWQEAVRKAAMVALAARTVQQ